MKSLALALSIVAAGPALAGAPAGTTAPPSKPTCPAAAPTRTLGDGRGGVQPLPPYRLGQPQALLLTVLRSVGGCPVATVRVAGQTYYTPLPSGADRAQPARR